MYGYGYRYNSGLVVSAGGGAPFANISSLQFDGVDDYLDVGDSDDFSFGNGTTDSPFSISAWVKMDGTGIFGILNKYGGASATSEYAFGFAANNKLQLVLTKSGSLYVYRGRRQNVTLNTGEWYHVVGTYDGRGGNLAQEGIKLYVNGVRVDDVDESYGSGYTAMGNTSTPVLLAKQTSYYSDGLMDEVAVFNSELSVSDVTDIYNLGTPNDLTDLNPIAWYRNGDNGSWKSPQWLIPNNENFAANKVSNYSFDFDGIDDKVELGTQSLGITGAISVSAWVKIPTSNTGGAAPNIQQFVCEDRLGGTDRNWALTWRGGTRNYFSFTVWNTNGSVIGINSVGVLANDGNWHHLLGTYDGTTSVNGLKLFVDGALNVQATMSSIGVRSSSSVIPTIASGSNSSVRQFEGNIDEVSIFDTDQSANIATIYNSGTPTTISGALANYRMGEDATFAGGVWTVPDAVGSNDGSSLNMTIEDRIGEAPNSSNNAVSLNMDEVDVVPDVP